MRSRSSSDARRGLLMAALVVPVLLASHGDTKAHVLGPEAAVPIKSWVSSLTGVRSTGVQIQSGVINIGIGPACTLMLTHPDVSTCPDASPIGDALACWSGAECPSRRKRASALRSAGLLRLPWRAATAKGTSERGHLLALRTKLQQHLVRHELDAARDILRGLRGRGDVRPIDWLSLAPLLAAAGERGDAWSIVTSDALASLDPVRSAVLRSLLLIGPEAGRGVAEALMTSENACEMVIFASTFLVLRHYDAAGALGASIRRLSPSCFDAYAIEAEAWTILRRRGPQRDVAEAAMARFPGDPRLVPITEAYYVDHGKGHLVQERLEAALAAGTSEAGVLKRLLSFYIVVEGRPERLAAFRARADAAPSDVHANFFTGVLLHYEKDYAASKRYLSRVKGKVSDEPRLFIYLAMNAFNLGDRPSAEAYISRAETLDLEDPDVPYCIAEIFRDTDRTRAVRALDRYWEMTRFTSDIHSVKQQRVLGMRAALRRCVDASIPAPCPGPWEHTFDSVAHRGDGAAPTP